MKISSKYDTGMSGTEFGYITSKNKVYKGDQTMDRGPTHHVRGKHQTYEIKVVKRFFQS